METGDAEHDGGSENDSTDDLRDDSRLTDQREGPVKNAAEDNDYACLGEKLVRDPRLGGLEKSRKQQKVAESSRQAR